MEVKPKKTVRFDALLKAAGPPVPVTLWTKPEDDRDFMRATKERRVVTVIQNNVGTQKDYGLVGFYPQERATYLLFGKRIDLPEETKVIGIKYDRLATAKPRGGIYQAPKPKERTFLPRKNHGQHANPERSAKRDVEEKNSKSNPSSKTLKRKLPKLFTFQARVELMARQTVLIDVETTSGQEAARLLKTRAEELTIDPAQSKVTRKVGKPQKKSRAADSQSRTSR